MSRPGGWRRRLARWSAPTPDRDSVPQLSRHDGTAGDAWREIAEQYALRVMTAAYQIGDDLDAIEADERDPSRLDRLYRIDHANSRIRRQAENLQVLAGRKVDDAGRRVTTLIDVIRASTSTIEQYRRVAVSRVAELAVVEFAADDVIRILTELLDNATRFSAPKTTAAISATLTETGSVLIRIEDAGIAIRPDQLDELNAMLAGDSDPLRAGRPAVHLGLAVVQRLALTHGIAVHLANRHAAGTIATVVLPEGLLCAPLPPSGPLRLPAAAPQPGAPRHAEPPRSGGDHNDPYAVAGGGAPPVWAAGGGEVADPGGGRHVGRAAPPAADDGRPAEADRIHTTGGLPVRVPTSLRDTPDYGTAGEVFPDQPANRSHWSDETADFAAGFGDALRFPHDSATEGHPR